MTPRCAARARLEVLSLAWVALAFIGGSGCHIMGISQIPCDPSADDQCPGVMVCRDEVCVPPDPVGEGEGEGETDLLGPVRSVDDNCEAPTQGPPSVALEMRATRAGAGADALHSRAAPFGGIARMALQGDACARRAASCELPTEFRDTTRAPVSVVAEYAVMDPAPLAGQPPAVQLDTGTAPFAFEMLARMPSSANTLLRLTATGGGADALEVSTATLPDGSQAEVSFSDNASGIGLAADVAGRWLHLLCYVDPVRAARSAAEGVLCAVDGGPSATGSIGVAPTLASAALDLTLPLGGDSALASLIVWLNADPLEGNNVKALDSVVRAARLRLLAYQGVTLVDERGPEAQPLASNRVLSLTRDPVGQLTAQPSLVLVGGRWPRTAMLDDDGGDDAALLLEPARADLARGALRACATGARDAFIGLEPAAAVHSACTVLDAALSVRAREDAPLVISAVVQRGRDSSVLSVDVGGELQESCSVSFPVTGPLAAPGCTLTMYVEADTDPALDRVVLVTTDAAPTDSDTPITVSFQEPGALLTRPAIWGAQVEQGRRATTVIDPGQNGDGTRETEQYFLHATVSELATVSWEIDVETPAVTGTYVPLALLRDQRERKSYLLAELTFSGGTLRSAARVAGYPFAEGGPPVTTEYAATAPALVGERALAIASTNNAENCGLSPGCSSVWIDPLAGRLALSHVALRASPETLRVHSVSAAAAGAGSRPLALSTRVEPRINGCTPAASVVAQLDLCPKDAEDFTCGDTPNLADVSAVSTVSTPVVGRQARVLESAARVDITLAETSSYLFEARFQVPFEDGPITSLEDDGGAPVLAIESEGGETRVVVPGGSGIVPTVAGEWVQLLCSLSTARLDPAVACYANLTDAPVFLRFVSYALPTGALVIRAGVTFDRVRLQELTDVPELGELLAAFRIPQSFGLHTSYRRAFVQWSERRFGLAYEQIGSELFLVGTGWPRTSVAASKPALLIEPALVDLLTDDFASFAPSGSVSASAAPGPGPRSLVFSASDVTLTASAAGGPGCASVFVRRISDDARAEIDVGGAAARYEAGASWRRISACSEATGDVTAVRIVVRGDVLLAHPQLDGLAVTAPVIDGVRERSALRALTDDLTLGTFGADLAFDANTRGEGVIAQLRSPELEGAQGRPVAPESAFRLRRAFDADNVNYLLLELFEAGSLVLDTSFALDPSGVLDFSLRETSLWLRTPTGNEVGGRSSLTVAPATELTIGAGDTDPDDSAVVRLHELFVQPILE